MGADNWAICPKCHATWEGAQAKALAEAQRQYGKIPRERYDELITVAENMEPDEEPTTLREDYEVGVHEGKFSVTYRCSCSVCQFAFGYAHEELLKVK